MTEPEPELFFSTVTVARVDFTDPNGVLNPIGGGSGEMEETDPFLSAVDPDDVLGSGDPALFVVIHATDPPVGSGNPDSLDSAIGFNVRRPGTYTDIEVPISTFPAFGADIGDNDVYPPNPAGDTEVVAQLWGDVGGGTTEEESLTPLTLPDETDPIRERATVTALDQNPVLIPRNGEEAPEGWEFDQFPFGDFGVKSGAQPDTSGAAAFGTAVDLGFAGSVVGAPGEDHSTDAGSTYVLDGIFEELEPGVAGLGDTQPPSGAEFGTAVAVAPSAEPPLLAVGAPGEAGDTGAVYVFGVDEVDGEGVPYSLLERQEGDSSGDRFGAAVDVSGGELVGGDGTLLVGAPGANGGEGTAAVFPVGEREGSESLDRSSDMRGPDDEFGASVALDLSIYDSEESPPGVVVGAPSAETGGETMAETGAAYDFALGPSEPRLLRPLSPVGGDEFGSAVDVSTRLGESGPLLTPVVGAPGTDRDAGTVYQFDTSPEPEFEGEESPGTSRFIPEQTLNEPAESGDRLGASVSASAGFGFDPEGGSGPKLLAGAPGGGYAALFESTGAEGEGFVGRFALPNPPAGFGKSVALATERGIIGAPDANGGTGVAFLLTRTEDDGGDVRL